MNKEKEEIRKVYFGAIPNARKINPLFQNIFDFVYEAKEQATAGKKLLEIYASRDASGKREKFYREHLFTECEYSGVDYWEDAFIQGEYTNQAAAGAQKHTIPFPDNTFDIVITTKYIFEHMSDPQKVINEIHRVLKPSGEAFLIIAHTRRQHQKPFDYFRMTEFAIEYMAKTAGFSHINIRPGDGFFVMLAQYTYFFQRCISMPRWLEKIFNWFDYWVTQPILFFLHRFDNGYGRDLSSYFFARLRK